jgi:hypothetical protein
MDGVEQAVVDRLAPQVAAQGLRLAHVDCPHWDGAVPGAMTCRGYVDGLVTTVRVLLDAAPRSTVGFDARLGSGVVATRNLERTLHEHGWADVDCGEVAAYPAHVGDGIVCRVRRGDAEKYVVATVRSRSGAVRIDDYPGSGAAE